MTAATRDRKRGRRSAAAARTIPATGGRPFVAPACALCGARLADRYGNPRWEILGEFTLVCLEACQAATA